MLCSKCKGGHPLLPALSGPHHTLAESGCLSIREPQSTVLSLACTPCTPLANRQAHIQHATMQALHAKRTHPFYFSLKPSDHLVCFSRAAPLVAQHNTPCTPLFNQVSGGQATVVQQGLGRGRGAAFRRSKRRSCFSLHLGRATPYSPRS